MFVYKSGTLKESNTPVANKPNTYVLRLTHVTSGMVIEVEYTINENNQNKPYIVYKEVDGQYVIYKKFNKSKDLKENFEDAIEFFEEEIFKQLKETPPQQTTPQPTPPEPPKTFQELPEPNDIVRIGNKFGRVVDADPDTEDVVVVELSKKEAMDILKAKRNAGRMNVNINDL